MEYVREIFKRAGVPVNFEVVEIGNTDEVKFFKWNFRGMKWNNYV